MRAIVSSRRKAQQLSKCSHTRPNSESQSWKSNSRRQFSAITYKSVNIQQPNDHRTASAPLYSPPPSQLTSAEPRTRSSGKTVRQPPASPASAKQKAPTPQSSTAHTPPGEDGHKLRAYQKQRAPILDPVSKQGSTHDRSLVLVERAIYPPPPIGGRHQR